MRVWKTVRSQEQIQDNLFRRLDGEQEDLLAYYTFDPVLPMPVGAPTVLADVSGRGNDLSINGAQFVLSTAPIGGDTPQVRSALAGVRTLFNDLIQSSPAVQEYGDLQTDAQGNLAGVLKRCYAYIKQGQWQLITGFKVGNLVTEWIGQVQFAPQLIGFIEGAPPVPSENLTMAAADYAGASSVELTQAKTATFTYAASKDTGFDMSVEAALKFGFKSKSETGAAAIAFVASTVEESVWRSG